MPKSISKQWSLSRVSLHPSLLTSFSMHKQSSGFCPTIFSCLFLFSSGNWHFWNSWLFFYLWVRSLSFPGQQLPGWRTAEETGQWWALENNSLFVQPWIQLQTWGQHSSPCVSLIILTGVSSCFLTSWLLQSSPQNWDAPQFRGSSFHSPSQGRQGTAAAG